MRVVTRLEEGGGKRAEYSRTRLVVAMALATDASGTCAYRGGCELPSKAMPYWGVTTNNDHSGTALPPPVFSALCHEYLLIRQT